MGHGTDETMDDQQVVPPRIPPRNTSVIVSVVGKEVYPSHD